MTEVPRLQVGVLKAPRCHLLDGPIGGGLMVGRAGQTWSIHIGQKVHGVHDLRVVRLFLADLLVDVGVSWRLGLGSSLDQ